MGVVVVLALVIGSALWRFGRSRPAGDESQPQSTASPTVHSAVEPAPPTQVVQIKPAELRSLDHFPGWADSSNAPLISQLLDHALPLKSRREAAHTLAKTGSDEAVAALKAALQDGSPYLKAGVGEALGECPHPEAADILADLLKGGDETVARGAVRGFALRDDPAAADILGKALFDAQMPESVRTEAALALGDVHQPAALATLTRAAQEIQDETIGAGILESLGKRPFAETADFFQCYLESPNLPIELKAAALEALGNATGDVAPFLLKYAGNPDPALRESAAWALALADIPGEIGPQLVELLNQETSPEVRARLYRALDCQDTYDIASILALARKEADPGARLAALNLLAGCCRSASTPELLSFFNLTAVPELKSQALAGESLNLRLEAVMALGRAGTSHSEGALQEIARGSSDLKVVQAAQTFMDGSQERQKRGRRR